jgi:para-nitrobenzyl esterase
LTDDFLDRVGARDEAQLLELPVEQLIVDATTFRSRSALQPIIEPNVLPVDPRQAVRDGAGAGIPLLIGYAADEQGGRHRDTVPAREALRRPGVPLERPDPDGSFDLATLSPQPDVAEVYRRSLTAAGRPSEPVDLYVALSSDLSIAAPSQRYAADQSRRAPTYLFCFAWPSPVESYAFGAYHGLLTPLLFGNRADPDWADVLNGLPDTVAGTLFDAVVSFVSGRQPWARYDPDRRETMVFDQDARVVADPERDRRLITGG